MPPKKKTTRKTNTITSYFDTFTKETTKKPKQAIPEVVEPITTNDDDDDDEEGSYFIDEVGNYYYRATKDSEPVLTEPPEGFESEYVAADEMEEFETIIEDLVAPVVPVEIRKSSRKRKNTQLVEPKEEEDTKQDIVGFYVDEVDEDEIVGDTNNVDNDEEHLEEENDEVEEVIGTSWILILFCSDHI